MLDPARCGLILIPAGGPATSEQFWLSEEQVKRLAPYFPRSRGKARVMTGACSAESSMSRGCYVLSRDAGLIGVDVPHPASQALSV